MEDDKLRGRHLAKLRKDKGLKQIDLAELLHYSDKNISKWENGKSFPTDPAILNSLANVLDVTIDELIYGYKDNDNNTEKNNFYLIFIIYKKVIFLLIFIFIIISFFIYSFSNIYYASSSNNNFENLNITIKFSKDLITFKFKRLISKNKNIDYVYFYYINDDDENLLFESENEDIIIKDFLEVSEYNFDIIVKSDCYLKIIYEDDSFDIIKFNFKKII